MHTVRIGFRNGKIFFDSSRKGVLKDISEEKRSKKICVADLVKNRKPVYKSLYIVTHPLIIPLARMEDSSIDALFLKRAGKAVIILAKDASYKWEGIIIS